MTSDSINDNYSLMDYFSYSNLINAFDSKLTIRMIKTIWRKELGQYTLFENEVSQPNVSDYTIYSFQDNDSVYSFHAGWGCDRDEIDENMLYIVAQEFNAANTSTSLFLTLADIYNATMHGVCKIEVNIACNDLNGDFANEIQAISIDEDILEIDCCYPLPCQFIDNRLIFHIDMRETNLRLEVIDNSSTCNINTHTKNYHLEIQAELKGTCVGNVFWNVFEISLSETTRFINFLLDINWSVSSAESNLFHACEEGEISEQDLELAFED